MVNFSLRELHDAICLCRRAGTRRSTSAARSTAWPRSRCRRRSGWSSTTDRPTRPRRSWKSMRSRLPYLRVVRRTDRGGRRSAPASSRPSTRASIQVDLEDFDYLCKLDMDLDLPVRYFEILMERMESNPRIGTTSGKPWFVHPQTGALVPRGLRRRDVGRHDQVLSGRLLQGDRRLRAPGDVGRHRLPSRPHARLDRRERRSRAHSLRSSAAAGREPQGHLDRTAARRLRPVFHGHLAALLSGGGRLSPAGSPGAYRQRRHAVGLPAQLAQGPAALRRSGVQAVPPLLPARLPAASANAPPPHASKPSARISGMQRHPTLAGERLPQRTGNAPSCSASSSTPSPSMRR